MCLCVGMIERHNRHVLPKQMSTMLETERLVFFELGNVSNRARRQVVNMMLDNNEDAVKFKNVRFWSMCVRIETT